jgi:hypothetical protein
MHGLMLMVFRNGVYLYIESDLAYALLVLASSTVVAYLMHQLDDFLIKKVLPTNERMMLWIA